MKIGQNAIKILTKNYQRKYPEVVKVTFSYALSLPTEVEILRQVYFYLPLPHLDVFLSQNFFFFLQKYVPVYVNEYI